MDFVKLKFHKTTIYHLFYIGVPHLSTSDYNDELQEVKS